MATNLSLTKAVVNRFNLSNGNRQLGMAKPIPSLDANAFSRRFLAGIASRPDLYPPGRGQKVLIAKRFSVTGATVTGWLNGEFMPTPERALVMAHEFSQPFMNFYFGEALAERYIPSDPKASPSVRLRAQTIRDAMALLDEYDAVLGHNQGGYSPERLAIAIEIVSSSSELEPEASNVVRLATRLRTANGVENDAGAA